MYHLHCNVTAFIRTTFSRRIYVISKPVHNSSFLFRSIVVMPHGKTWSIFENEHLAPVRASAIEDPEIIRLYACNLDGVMKDNFIFFAVALQVDICTRLGNIKKNLYISKWWLNYNPCMKLWTDSKGSEAEKKALTHTFCDPACTNDNENSQVQREKSNNDDITVMENTIRQCWYPAGEKNVELTIQEKIHNYALCKLSQASVCNLCYLEERNAIALPWLSAEENLPQIFEIFLQRCERHTCNVHICQCVSQRPSSRRYTHLFDGYWALQGHQP